MSEEKSLLPKPNAANGRTVLFSGINFAILGYFPVRSVHGRVGRTTTRIFGVVVLADKQLCRKPRIIQLNLHSAVSFQK